MSTAQLHVQKAWRCGDAEGRPGWCVQFRYDVDGLRRLKALIPAALRTWDNTAKVWWFHEGVIDQLARMAPGVLAYTAQAKML